ncbi:hypothetical protein [Pseudochrobactrum sp. MP213Fo]|uniref:hypothetical protein n=1 Tax=Pseudochrobactrum sp. MP213Fo TaxID=3022250 RepID=UPI003BA10459
MAIEQYRHKPAPQVHVARAITANRKDQQRLTLIRLLGTTVIGAALLSGSAIYARAASTETPAPEQHKAKAADTSSQAQADEQAPTEAVTPAATKEVAGGLVLPDYLDDRSTPQKLLESYYNAVNRKEYARAYSYYAQDTQEPDFSQYAKGYEGTQSVTIKLGKTEPDPGAGQIYWSLPIAIESTLNDGKTQVYTGCYTISMTNPAMQEVPPFKPMAIRAGTLSKSPQPLQESVPEECEAP